MTDAAAAPHQIVARRRVRFVARLTGMPVPFMELQAPDTDRVRTILV